MIDVHFSFLLDVFLLSFSLFVDFCFLFYNSVLKKDNIWTIIIKTKIIRRNLSDFVFE